MFAMKMINGRGLVLTHAHMSTTGQLSTYVLGGTRQLLGAGYHVYKDIWMAVEDEMLDCTREAANRFDPYAVVVMKRGVIVGHLPLAEVFPQPAPCF